MLGRVALLLLVAGSGPACGSRELRAPIADGGSAERAADSGVSARDLLWPGTDLRPSACGGVVQASGSAFGQVFQAGYVYVLFVGGDCARHLDVTIAASEQNEGVALVLSLRPSPDSRTFVGHAVQEAALGTPVQRFQADVDVTAAPDPAELEQGLMEGAITGSFTIDTPDVSITGGFSSAVCRNVSCV